MDKLILNKVQKKLWTYFIVNFITNLLLVVNKEAILVVYDKMSKMIHFIATIEKMAIERLACLFRNNM